ncbi:MAG: hypothetical protein Q8L48_42900 [Archangium sp.]|nr:hypothetical protein [Archangium sp.]
MRFQTVVTATQDASHVFAGAGDGAVYDLGLRGTGPASRLDGEWSDLLCTGEHLLAVKVDREFRLDGLMTRPVHGGEWTRLAIPRPARVKGSSRASGDPDAVLLCDGPLGQAMVEKGTGLVVVLPRRSGPPAAEFALKLAPGIDGDFWTATPTPQGVLVMVVEDHRRSTLLHLAPGGKVLGKYDSMNSWGARAMTLLGDHAFIVAGDLICELALPDLSLLSVETAEFEVHDYAGTANQPPGKMWLGQDNSDDIELLTAHPGRPPHLGRSHREIRDGLPAFALLSNGPALSWEGTGEKSIDVTAPTPCTWKDVMISTGKQCSSVRLRVSSVLIGARVLEVTARLDGKVLPLKPVPGTPLELAAQCEGMGSGARLQVELTFKARGEGRSTIDVIAEPLTVRSVWDTPSQLVVGGKSAAVSLPVTVG